MLCGCVLPVYAAESTGNSYTWVYTADDLRSPSTSYPYVSIVLAYDKYNVVYSDCILVNQGPNGWLYASPSEEVFNRMLYVSFDDIDTARQYMYGSGLNLDYKALNVKSTDRFQNYAIYDTNCGVLDYNNFEKYEHKPKLTDYHYVADSVIAGVDLRSVLDEVVNLLPVVLAVLVGFIALRKGISFVKGVLHSA